jgi:hypothetical protein
MALGALLHLPSGPLVREALTIADDLMATVRFGYQNLGAESSSNVWNVQPYQLEVVFDEPASRNSIGPCGVKNMGSSPPSTGLSPNISRASFSVYIPSLT